MPTLEQLLTAVPGGGRVYYSGRWARKLAAVWRSRNRQFLAFPPGHFASPLPDYAELAADAARVFAPPPAALPGIDVHADAQLRLLAELAPFAAEIPFPAAPAAGFRYHFDNDFFAYADGTALYAMLRRFAPKRVVEVGSGFSSALMLDVCEKFLDGATQFTFVEPYPDRLKALLTPADKSSVTILPNRVQDVPAGTFAGLAAGDFLFIDSTHVSKIGSDVNQLLFEVLPALPAGVIVHVHDVFWPFEYPRAWLEKGYAWNEQYLLRAFLQYNAAFEVLFFPSYLEAFHATELAGALPTAVTRSTFSPTLGGGSIYLRKTK